jgi:hypothetical protein
MVAIVSFLLNGVDEDDRERSLWDYNQLLVRGCCSSEDEGEGVNDARLRLELIDC